MTVDSIVSEFQTQFDHESIDGCILASATLRARMAFARSVGDGIDEADLTKRLGEKLTATDKKIQKMEEQLTEGAVFTKFKHGSSSKRLIWCPPSLSCVMWGDVDRMTIKGSIPTSAIQEVNQGFGKNKCRLYIVSEGRTLEIEGKEVGMVNEWKQLIDLLLVLYRHESVARELMLKDEAVKHKIAILEQEYCKLLVQGDVFTKWPGKKKIQKGGSTSRRLWASDNLDRLQWGEIENNKVKGFLLMSDVVYVQQEPEDHVKFTVWALKRSLDLEAKSVWVREKWMRALNFFVEMKKR